MENKSGYSRKTRLITRINTCNMKGIYYECDTCAKVMHSTSKVREFKRMLENTGWVFVGDKKSYCSWDCYHKK